MTTVTSPSDLLSAIPFLIGYQPKDSIVLISLKNEAIDMAIRVDFPEVLKRSEARSLAKKLEGSDGVLLVTYIPESCEDAESVVRPLTEALEALALPLRESIVVVADRWKSLICLDDSCCQLKVPLCLP